MSAGTTLIHTIPGAYYDSCLERFKSSIQKKPFHCWLILPTHRLIRTVRDDLIASNTPFIPDHICTLDQFCEYLISRYGESVRYVKTQAARVILSDVINENEKDLSLFFSQRTPSPRTLQELQTLISVITRREIAYPDCLGDLQSLKSTQIHRIVSAYKNRLRKRNLVDGDTLLEWTITFLQECPPDQCTGILKEVYCYGHFEPLPLEKRVITTLLGKSEQGSYVIPTGSDTRIFSDSGRWIPATAEEVYSGTETEQNRTGIFSSDYESESPDHLSGIALTACSDPVTEMRRIAEEIISLHANHIPYHDMVVAFPDIRSALTYAREIFPDYAIPYHSSSSSLLLQSPLITFFMQIFELVEKGMRYEDLIQVVHSPYLQFWWISTETDGTGDPASGSEDVRGGEECKKNHLLYKNLEIIGRTYGISTGYVDWESQTERIVGLITGTDWIPDMIPGDQGAARQSRGYEPEPPLPVKDILSTLEGVRQLNKVFAGLAGKRVIKEHIRVYKDVLAAIGAPVPDPKPLTKSGNRILSPGEIRAISRFSAVLDEMQILARSGTITDADPDTRVSFPKFLTVLRLLIQDISEEPDPDESGVLLTGIRELAHQHYPYLFLASLNEGLIPRLSTRLPFTNGSENSRMETRSLGDILREERYHFIAALLAGSEKVYLSYHQHRDERTTLSSPFLDPLKKRYTLPDWNSEGEKPNDSSYTHSHPKPMIPEPGQCSLSQASRRAGEFIREGRWDEALAFLGADQNLASVLQRITIERNYRFRLYRSAYDGLIGGAPDVRERICTRFGPKYRWSASMLETYARCPFRFYLERVVRIKPLADQASDLSPIAKGNLIHTILCRFTREMSDAGGFPIRESALQDAVSVITTIAEDEFEKVPYKTPLWHAKKRQLLGGSDIGTGIFERFVTAERERLSPDEKGRNPEIFTPRFFEYSFGAVPGPDDDPMSSHDPVDLAEIARDIRNNIAEDTGAGDLSAQETDLPCSGPVLLSGKIDRIDITNGGMFGVVDYKTGMKIPSTTEISQIKSLQLPLYIHAFAKITGHTGVYGSYYHIQRTISHSISLYDPDYKETLPQGKMPRSVPDWKGIMHQSVFDACTHVSRIHEGVFPIQSCTSCSTDWFCPYGSICRFQSDRGSGLCEWMEYTHPAEDTGGEQSEIGGAGGAL
ncbi:MAG TPA: PD-(D/E)XK nuclease family protein [Methanospirillum sp.]|nr:PD-(D/E)XK nuclease family protein [Methanospirillum sp.]